MERVGSSYTVHPFFPVCGWCTNTKYASISSRFTAGEQGLRMLDA